MGKDYVALERVKELETQVFLYKLRIKELEELVARLQSPLLNSNC